MMEPSTPARRRVIKIELSASLLNLPFITIFLYLLYSNHLYWDLFNHTLSTAFGLDGAWVQSIIVLLYCIAIANLAFIVVGTARIGVLHRVPVVLALPAITMAIMFVMLVSLTNVVDRVNLDYIFFLLGSAALPVYLAVTIAVFAVLALIWYFCAALWRCPARGPRRAQPKIAAVSTLATSAMAAAVLWWICFTYTSTALFWRGMGTVYASFVPWTSAGFLGWFAAIATTIVLQVARAKGRIPGGRVYLVILAGLAAAHVVFLVLAIMAFPLQQGVLWTTMLPVLLPGSVAAFLPSLVPWVRARLRQRLTTKRARKRAKVIAITCALLVPYAFVFHLPLAITFPPVSLVFTERLVTLEGIEVPFQGDLVFPSFEAQPQAALHGDDEGRRVLRLDGEWRWSWTGSSTDVSMFPRTPVVVASLSGGQHLPDFNDDAWDTITIPRPNCFPYWEGTEDEPRYGVFWYRKVIDVPSSFTGHQIVLKFFGGGHVLDAWVNGEHIGYHEVTSFGFAFDVSGEILPGAENLIAIRVDDPDWKHARNPGHAWHTNHLPPSIDLFKYGGLTREIHLEAVPRASIARADARVLDLRTVDHLHGNVTVQVDVVALCPPSGPLAGATMAVDVAFYPLSFNGSVDLASRETWTFANLSSPVPGGDRRSLVLSGANGTQYTAIRFVLDLTNVSFWSTKHPNLHALAVNLTVPATNETIDTFWTQTGFRTLETNGTRLLLNGADLVLAGVAVHEETWDPHGMSMTDEQIVYQLERVRNVSANFARLGHAPVHPNWHLFAERMGIATWAEGPLCWMNEIHFTQLLARDAVEPVWIQTVYPNFNRPGILFWGGPNEPWAAADCIRFLQVSNVFLARVDGTRFFSYAAVSSHTWHSGFRDANLPVLTPNNYGGTFDGVRYAFYNETRASISEWQQNNPGKPLVVMEFGYWREGRWNGSAWVPDFENQIKCLEETFQAFVELGAVGMTWWIAFDYFGATDDGWYQNGMGVYSLDGSEEYPTAEVMRTLYTDFVASNL